MKRSAYDDFFLDFVLVGNIEMFWRNKDLTLKKLRYMIYLEKLSSYG